MNDTTDLEDLLMSDPSPDRESTTRAPRWVKVFGIIALALVMMFAIMMLSGGGGGHGPGRHTSSGARGDTSASSLT